MGQDIILFLIRDMDLIIRLPASCDYKRISKDFSGLITADLLELSVLL